MTAIEFVNLSACDDCLIFVANGEEPDGRDDLTDDIESVWPSAEWSLGCGHDEPERDESEEPDDSLGFSWQPCECCGSRLGGNRSKLFAQPVTR
jgi:hypothetical protein